MNENPEDYATFSDDNKLQVQGRDNIKTPKINQLQNVLYDKELKANLISISHLCDNQHILNFTKNECKILDKHGDCVLKGKGVMITIIV